MHRGRAWAHTPHTHTPHPSPPPQEYFARAGLSITAVACGSYHSCAIARDGTLFTWGGALFGKLGHGDEAPCPLPRPVAALRHTVVVQVACGRCVGVGEGVDGRHTHTEQRD